MASWAIRNGLPASLHLLTIAAILACNAYEFDILSLQSDFNDDPTQFRDLAYYSPAEDIALSVESVLSRSHQRSVSNCERQVCFGEMDCFNPCSGPLKHIRMPPQDPDIIGTTFTLHTRDTLVGVTVTTSDVLPAVTFLDRPLPLVILVHGFTDTGHGWPEQVKNSVLAADDRCVLIVDWTNGCRSVNASPFYAQAIANTELVGRQIAVVLDKLMQSAPNALKPQSTHFVGHCLGAHVAKFFAEYFYLLAGLKIGRATALDPTSPLLEEYNITIDRSVADSVQVLHTSAATQEAVSSPAGMARRGKLGIMQPIGHLDFYVNGGRRQPGCPNYDPELCSHKRAYEYFMAAVSPLTACVFRSYACVGGRQGYLTGKCSRIEKPARSVCLDFDIPEKQTTSDMNVQFVDVTGQPPFCV